MKGFEPSTFAMARRRSSQLSYIRTSQPVYSHIRSKSRRRSRGAYLRAIFPGATGDRGTGAQEGRAAFT
jgi:hypothetical protein